MRHKKTKFEKMKRKLQDILDKHLSPEDRFSVKEFSKEEIRYLCRLLLEKDDKKRQLILKEIEDRVNELKYECDCEFNEVERYKNLFDIKNKVFNETDEILDDIELENQFDSELSKI